MAQNLNTVAAIVLDEHLTTIKVKFQNPRTQQIHDHAQVDPDDGINYCYAFAVVHREALDALKAREESLVKRIKAARRETWRKQLLGDIDAQAVLAAPSTGVDLERKSPFTQVAEKCNG